MPFHDVSGIGAWGMLYLCSVKSSKELTQKIGPIPPRLPRIIRYYLVLPQKEGVGWVIGTGTLVRYLSRISGTCPYDSFFRHG